jgi:SSS family solute:Na+ symporter/sodium/pantothenate symporter
MSTTDSALLSISSMISRDIYGAYIRRQAGEAELTRIGKYASWLVIAAMVWVSTLEDLTLLGLLVLKFEILIQVAPAFYLGTTCPQLRASAILGGLLAGLAVSLTLWALDAVPYGIHPGVIGLFVNLAIVAVIHMIKSNIYNKI